MHLSPSLLMRRYALVLAEGRPRLLRSWEAAKILDWSSSSTLSAQEGSL